MLALSSFALSYAPVFVAPPLAVRSTAVHMNHGMRPVFYDHDQEGFRNRKSSYTTALDCWSSNDPRAPGQRPNFAEQQPPPGTPVAAPPVEAPTENTRDSSPHSSPHTAARPIYYDHDHESFRDRKAYTTALDCWSSNSARTPGQRPFSARQQPAAQRAVPPVDHELSAWLQEALGGQARDVSMCARLLAADGCRCVADVYMLAEADELSAEIPKVMRMKIVRACELL